MPATNVNEYFIEAKPLWVGKVGAGGVASAVAETFPLQSASGLTDGNVYVVTANRVNSAGTVKNPSNERETFIGKLSGTNLINCIRQVEGEAQAWEADTVLEVLISSTIWNRLVEGLEVEHNPDGTHKMQGFDESHYADDEASDDDYIVTLSPTPVEYFEGMIINFKANTANTGACTLDVNELGAKAIKTPDGEDPANSQIPANSIVTVIYDGTNFVLQSIGGLKSYIDGQTVNVQMVIFNFTDDAETGDGKFYFLVPAKLNGMNLTSAVARVITAGTTNTMDIQIANVTDSVDMLSTKLTIDSGETSSSTANTPVVIDTTKDDIATNDLLRIDVDAVHTTKAKGLIVTLGFNLP